MVKPKHYSKPIVGGLRLLGLSDTAIQRAAGLTAAAFRAIANGEREFTDRQLLSVERATDKSIMELAAMVLEPEGGSFTELAEASGEFRRSIAGRRSSLKKPLNGSSHRGAPKRSQRRSAANARGVNAA
jgi:hypothetical protein